VRATTIDRAQGAHPLLVALAAWLVPGAGHLWMGQRAKGLVFLLVLPAMFATGLTIDGRIFPFEPQQPLVALAALADLGIGLELAELDVLVAIEPRLGDFDGATQDETTVGTVADRLSIDPSRASRIVAGMVERGFAVRGVSQADARRAVVRLTNRGRAAVAAVQEHKALLLGDFLSEWSREELETFLPMLERFSGWSEGTEARRTRFSNEIAAIAARLRDVEPA
jgi:DNA-binding MarR family transcriptional regulator